MTKRAAKVRKRKEEEEEEDEEDGGLCCCEYVNSRGERSHVAACCCDCEDLDEAFDRFLKREPQRPESLSKVSEVLSDRLRVPWFWGGARRVDLSVVPPLVLLPALLRLAALHFLLGVAVLTALPALVLWYYCVTHRKKGRTLFFLSLALFSLGYMYYLFVTEVWPLGGVGPAQVAAVTAGVSLTLVALVVTKRDPGVVRPSRVHGRATYCDPSAERDSALHGEQQRQQGATMSVANRAGRGEGEGAEPSEGRRSDWCAACRVARPPRAGHCRICGVCVRRLDHHCVWINNCVGQANHRSFLLTLLLFLLTSLYGISLVLKSVCPEQLPITALLYCPGVYDKYSTALCFTCAWYSSIVTGGLLHLLLVQVINISHNVTEREARLALRDKSARSSCCGLVVDTGIYCRGVTTNWAEFLQMVGKVEHPSPGPTDVV